MWIWALKPGWARLTGPILVLVLAIAGCGDPDPEPPARSQPNKDQGPFANPGAKKVPVDTNIWLEVAGNKRRVLVSGEICLRQGPLEQFMTRKQGKTHESIVAADIDARQLHKALLLAGAVPGSPMQFSPVYRTATGTVIRVKVSYIDKGKLKVVPARSWVRNEKTKTELETDWVFAGSHLVENPLDTTAPKKFLANDGDVVCVSNCPEALLDIPIKSSKSDADRNYEAWTERIPEVGTKVVIAFEPELPTKKGKL